MRLKVGVREPCDLNAAELARIPRSPQSPNSGAFSFGKTSQQCGQADFDRRLGGAVTMQLPPCWQERGPWIRRMLSS